MSIQIKNLKNPTSLHVSPRGELYVSEGYFAEPSVMMRSLESGNKMNGGMTCLNFDGFISINDMYTPGKLRQVIVKLTELISSKDTKYADLVDKYAALQEDYGDLLDKAHKLQDRINDVNHGAPNV